MRRLITGVLVLAIATSAFALPKPPERIACDRGWIVWYPRPFVELGDEELRGWEVLAVIERYDGGYDVFRRDDVVYQDETLAGRLTNGRRVSVRYLEVVLGGAEPGRGAGFRSLARLDEYIVPLYTPGRVGRQEVRVFGTGESYRWLVKIVTVGGEA